MMPILVLLIICLVVIIIIFLIRFLCKLSENDLQQELNLMGHYCEEENDISQ